MRERSYGGEQDLRRMEGLVEEAWAQLGPRFECAVGDLSWRMYRSELVHPRENIHLWESDGGELLGFAWFYLNGDVDLMVYPRAHCDAVVPRMVAWAEARFAEPGSTDRPDRRLFAWALDSNEPLVSALLACGLARTPRCYLNLWRSLEAPVEPAALPEGYRARAVVGPEEAAPRAAVHRAAFGSNRVSAEVYRRLMAAPRYRADLDVVVVAPGGDFAAMALGWLDDRNRVGELEPVGTAPAHRRRGLARAAVLAALRRMQEAGATAAVVYALEEDEASVDLYQSAGFSVIDRSRGFTRPGPPSPG